jgi:membrane-bound lytic murein transglycosylase MltF
MAKIIKIELDLDEIIEDIKQDTAECAANEEATPKLTLKDYVLRHLQYEVSNRISQDSKDQIQKFCKDFVDNNLPLLINNQVQDWFKKPTIRIYNETKSLEDYVSKVIEGKIDFSFNQSFEKLCNTIADKTAKELSKRYDLQFATAIVNKMAENNLLKESKVKELLTDNKDENC